ncbi:MAG: diadenylate cyclase [Candidatus Coproplasma sp.]
MNIQLLAMNGQFWIDYWEKVKNMALSFDLSYILEFLIFTVSFYLVFKILKENKATKLIVLLCLAVVTFGVAVSFSNALNSATYAIIIILLELIVLTVFNTEIKRSLLGTGNKKHIRKETDTATVRDIEYIIDEFIHAVQHMSKNDIGALIVLSNNNLPEGIISSGTTINADINAPMIEAIFYPKAPLHDGAMIIDGYKIHAAGCFLPLIQNDNLPQEVGSRHRAALGVTAVASVTAIVVSEETGIISIAKNGEIVKKYASDSDLKNLLSDYYWTDLTGGDLK